MRPRFDAAQLGIGDVVLGDDVGDQRAHAHEPAAQPDQRQRADRQDGVAEQAADELPAPVARHVHLVAAADRQHRPQVAEHDEQQEGHDVVGDGMEGHRQHAGEAQRAVLAVVAGEPAQQVAEHPGEQGRDHEQRHRPGQRAADQHRRPASGRPTARGRSRRRRRGARTSVLLGQAAFEAIELLQRLAHQRDRLGAGAAELGGGGDRLLDRVDRRCVRDDEGDVDADEHDQGELAQAAQQVDRRSLS